jgi:hypothetical protein
MPSWKSINGVWKPAHERTYDGKKDEMYEGPDRAAMEVLEEKGLETLGMPVENDPQIMELARQRNQTVKQYMKQNAPLPSQLKAQEEAQTKVIDHKEAPKKRGVQPRGGGVTIRGGFGDIPA